ncbi:aminotransferase class IV [Acetivibrio clariflavus]|uniref:Branched-chain amino acid aminotransferase/4-amino-4-deoxychorismate lyase n=1 Tax=Acetivibrio clariflavus (strain DSM 19732 / NBRC 101661 / EBR45) TaxID=720554 RepID=G8LU12_ACECE|nr:aminotransferase class IV [Acetivibrio clariflavus]AEV68400.1 branched-chain amino acid aminotransferase/4-amino-4-deoxychorismate lyase [Acetivibrio clariflavus DSM 19732]
MFRLVETIKLNDGVFENIDIHNERFNNSRKTLFGVENSIDLNEILHSCEYNKTGLYKCRVVYNKEIIKVEFVPYVLKQIKSLKVVRAEIDYSYKYEDRSDINKLLELRGSCDDILIVKNDRLTDTSAANIAFFDDDRWYTPLYPLLKGTEREKLLRERKIFEEDLRLDDLKRFHKAAIFSTMVNFGEIIIPVSNIVY